MLNLAIIHLGEVSNSKAFSRALKLYIIIIKAVNLDLIKGIGPVKITTETYF